MSSRSREIVICGYCDRSGSVAPWKGKQQYLKQHVSRKHAERLVEFEKKPRARNPFWDKFLSTRAVAVANATDGVEGKHWNGLLESTVNTEGEEWGGGGRGVATMFLVKVRQI